MPYALLLFIAMPIVEIAILLRVGDVVGWVPTLLIVITTAIIGSGMLRQQGLATLNKARQRMNSGELPAQQLLEGVLIMIGGVLLLTPGFVTDAFGFLCLIPVTRQWMAARVAARATLGFVSPGGAAAGRGDPGVHGSGGAPGRAPPHEPSMRREARQSGNRGEIIDGDFKRIDDD